MSPGGSMERINCLQCVHYFNTWDKLSPRGCRKYDFKSTTMPSQLVRNESGMNCQSFEKKAHFKKEKIDLNDPSLW